MDATTDAEELTTVSAAEVVTSAEAEPAKKDNGMFTWILLGGVGLLVILGAYYIKVVRKKDGDFLDEDDEDDEEVYENEDEDLKADDFFDNKDDNEDEQGKEE